MMMSGGTPVNMALLWWMITDLYSTLGWDTSMSAGATNVKLLIFKNSMSNFQAQTKANTGIQI